MLRSSGNVGENLVRGLSIVHDRSHGSGFGQYEGMILGPATIDKLTKHFREDFPWMQARNSNNTVSVRFGSSWRA